MEWFLGSWEGEEIKLFFLEKVILDLKVESFFLDCFKGYFDVFKVDLTDMVSLLELAPLVSFHEVESFIVEFVLLVCEFLQAVGFPVLEFTFGGKEPAEEDAEFHGRISARRALACL